MIAILAIWEDERPIRKITTVDGAWSVDCDGVTRIAAYLENGQEDSVPWLAVYCGNWLTCRVNAAHVKSVWYGRMPETSAHLFSGSG